jgi:hypothetical protein
MNHCAFIDGPPQLALICAAVSLLLTYLVHPGKWRTSFASPAQSWQSLSIQPESEATTFFRTVQQSRSPLGQRAGRMAEKPPDKGRLAVVADWLVPVIVWFLVIMMGLAIVGFLLGDR